MTNYQWQPDVIEDFGGVNNQADPYNDAHSQIVQNFEIDLDGNLVKTKGYERIGFLSDDVTAIVSDGSVTKFTLASTASYSNNDLVIAYNFVETGIDFTLPFSGTLAMNLYKVTVVNGTTLSIDADTSDRTTTGGTCKLDLSLKELGNSFFASNSISLSEMGMYGSYTKEGVVYRFLGQNDSNYLCKLSMFNANSYWVYAEATPTEFTTDDKAYFVEYDDELIFTKNEKKQIGSDYGGTFYLNVDTLALYAKENNPTAKYIAVHNDRIWVGNISYQENTAVSGSSWVIPSKISPESVDTSFTVSGVGVGTITTITTSAPHSLVVGDRVYFTGIVGSVGTDLLNGNYWEVTGTDTSKIFLGDCNSTGLAYTSGGTIQLRGYTWGVSVFDNVGYGSGIIKCDNNSTDYVMNLVPSKGAIFILRRLSIYIFTGSIETGDATLARQLNVPYGAISSSVATTDGGVFFVSQYGISQIQGVTVKTVKTEFDNLQTLSVSEPIRDELEKTGNNSSLSVFRYDRYLWVYDSDRDYIFQFDLLKNNWIYRTHMKVQDLFLLDDDTYIGNSFAIYKLNTGHVVYTDPYTTFNFTSVWQSNIRVQGLYNYMKAYKDFYALCYTKNNATDFDLMFELRYDSSNSKRQTFSLSVPSNTQKTWDEITEDGTLTWDEITSNGTLTWDEITGLGKDNITLKKYGLLSAKTVEVKMTHSNPSDFKCNRLIIYYDALGIQKIAE